MGEEKKKRPQKKAKKSLWKDSTLRITIIGGLTVGIVISFFQFILPRIYPEKPPPPEIEVAPIQYLSKGLPLLEIIKHIEGETDYDVIATKDVEEIKINGSFEGNDWVHILKKVINAYDKQLKLDMDEKNKKITITLKFVNE
jgi:hypothetical protein